MLDNDLFPALTEWESTHQTLHLYSQAVAVVPRTHSIAHPKWWHVSLNVLPEGLETDHMTLPDGGQFWLKIDFQQHRTILFTGQGPYLELELAGGLTATQFGDVATNPFAYKSSLSPMRI